MGEGGAFCFEFVALTLLEVGAGLEHCWAMCMVYIIMWY